MYEVKAGEMIETIDLLDSDDEETNSEVSKRDDQQPREQPTEPKDEKQENEAISVIEVNPDASDDANKTVVDVDVDVDQFCDDLEKNSGIEGQNGFFDDEVIEILDEEEETNLKNWMAKLSQGHSQSPPLCNRSSVDSPNFEDKSDSNSSHSEQRQHEPPLTLQTEGSGDSIFETPEPSPESSSSKGSLVVGNSSITDSLTQPNLGTTVDSGLSELQPSLHLNTDIEKIALRDCTIQIERLSQSEINRYIHANSSDEKSSDKSTSSSDKSRKRRKALPSNEKKLKDALKITEKLKSICDEETDVDNEPKAGTKLKPERNGRKVGEPSKAGDSLQNSGLIKKLEKESRQKASSESGVKVANIRLPIIPKKNKSRSSSPAQISKAGESNKSSVEAESSVVAVEEKKVSKPMPKRRMTISEVTKKINIPSKNIVPIIEAPTMKKRRLSTYDVVLPKMVDEVSTTSHQGIRKRRQTVCEIDMFAAASMIRNEGPMKRRKSIDLFSSDLKLQKLEIRKEKLRKIAEQNLQNEVSESKASRSIPTAKVKITENNRGSFLTEEKPFPPRRKSVNLPEASVPAPAPNYQKPRVAPKVVESPPPFDLNSMINNFKQQFVLPATLQTVVPTIAAAVTSASNEVSSEGPCNNVDFYRENQFDLDLPSTSSPAVGFYQQYSFTQNTSTPFVPTEESKPTGEKNKVKKKVSFPEEINQLEQYKFFYRDDEIFKILKWETSSLTSFVPTDDNCHDKQLLGRMRAAYLTKHPLGSTISWSSLNVVKAEQQGNDLTCVEMLSKDSHRGFRPGSLLILKMAIPTKHIESEKFGYIVNHSVTEDIQSRIIVHTTFSSEELGSVKSVRSCSPFTSDLQSLLEHENHR